MTTILIKKKDTAGAPAAGDLTNAAGGTEIAVNTATKRIYTKDSGGNVVELGTNASAMVVGSLTDSGLTSGRVTYATTGGLLTDSANMVFTGSAFGVNIASPSSAIEAADNVSGGTFTLTTTNTNSGSNVSKYSGIKFRGVDTLSALKDTGYIKVAPIDQNYVASNMQFYTRSADAVSLRMTIDKDNTLLNNFLSFGTDNTYDIGYSTNYRPRSIYAATSVVTSTYVSGYGSFASPALQVGDNQYGLYVNTGILKVKNNGAIGFRNTADTADTFAFNTTGGYFYIGAGSTNNFPLVVTSTSTGGQDILLEKRDSGTGNQNNGIIRFYNYAPTNTGRAAGVRAGGFYFTFSQPTSGALQDAAQILCISETQSGTSTSSALTFYTNSGSAGNSLAMTIASNKYVGINEYQDTPYRLTVGSNATGTGNVGIIKYNSGTGSQDGQALRFLNYGPSNVSRNSGVTAGEIYFGFSQPTSGAIQDAAQILVQADGSQNGTSTQSKMMFYTSSGASDYYAGQFDSAQRFLVATGTAVSRVTAYQYGGDSFACVTNDGDSSSNFGIRFRIENQGHTIGRVYSQYVTSASGGSGSLHLQYCLSGTLKTGIVCDYTNTIQFPQYGAGTLSTNSSGYISASDGRYKTKTRGLTDALSKVRQLASLSTYYRWNEDSPWGKHSQEEEIGWVAQDVATVIPEASPESPDPEQFRNYHDRAILAYLTKALDDLAAEFEAYKAAHA